MYIVKCTEDLVVNGIMVYEGGSTYKARETQDGLIEMPSRMGLGYWSEDEPAFKEHFEIVEEIPEYEWEERDIHGEYYGEEEYDCEENCIDCEDDCEDCEDCINCEDDCSYRDPDGFEYEDNKVVSIFKKLFSK